MLLAGTWSVGIIFCLTDYTPLSPMRSLSAEDPATRPLANARNPLLSVPQPQTAQPQGLRVPGPPLLVPKASASQTRHILLAMEKLKYLPGAPSH